MDTDSCDRPRKTFRRDHLLELVDCTLTSTGYSAVDIGAAGEFARQALAASRRFFREEPAAKATAGWSGKGVWSGFQPIPEGDIDHVDLLERFEVPAPGSPDSRETWPSLAEELLTALRSLVVPCLDLVKALLVDNAPGRPVEAADVEDLWITGHASTVVANYYAGCAAHPVVMKPHRDFGGLTVLFFEPGTADRVEFQLDGGWEHLPAETACCVVAGELLGGWLGCPAPTHRVVGGETDRYSVAFFHQPAFDRFVPFADGTTVEAGKHITARQAYYNALDRRYL